MYPFFLYLILYFKISSKTDAFLVEQHEKSPEEFFCIGHLLSLSESSLIFLEVLPSETFPRLKPSTKNKP